MARGAAEHASAERAAQIDGVAAAVDRPGRRFCEELSEVTDEWVISLFDAAVEARSLGRLRMAALHLFSKLDAAVFDRKWRALPSSAAVFDTTVTTGRTWLSYARPGGAPPRWQWPFFYAADDAELARLRVELL